MYRLLHRFTGDHLPLNEIATTLDFATGLGQARFRLAQGSLRLRTRRLLQLGQGSLSFAHSRCDIVRAQYRQHVARLHDVALLHTTPDYHASDRAADLRTRDSRHATGGHDRLHQRLRCRFVSGQRGPAQLLHQHPC